MSDPLFDSVQRFIDRKAGGMAGKWSEPPTQEHCHPLHRYEDDLLQALDEEEVPWSNLLHQKF